MEEFVRRSAQIIRSRYSEPITLNEIASEVFVSPYHFSRIFSRAIGLTPGRYLTAVRLFAAKRLLLTTDLTVSDIVCSVGYNSVGTFTSKFTRVVGMSPTQYRDPAVSRLFVAVSSDFSRMPELEEMVEEAEQCRPLPGRYTGVLRGTLDIPGPAGMVDVMVGVFSEVAPQRSPLAFQAFAAQGRAEFEIRGVPSGLHHVLAIAAPQVRGTGPGMFTAVARRQVGAVPMSNTPMALSLCPPRESNPPVAVTLADTSRLVGAGALRAMV